MDIIATVIRYLSNLVLFHINHRREMEEDGVVSIGYLTGLRKKSLRFTQRTLYLH